LLLYDKSYQNRMQEKGKHLPPHIFIIEVFIM